MFLLSWLIGLYLALHIESFMSVPLGLDRVLKSSSYLFYPLIVIGFLGIANFFKDKKVRTVAKVALSSLFFILLISSNANKAYTTLKQAYPPILRMTPAQYEAAQWIDENLAEYVIIYSIGTITYPKTRWIHMFSHKATIPGIYVSMEKAANITIDFPLTKKVTHLLVDYSDYLLINNQDKINEIKLFEEKYASDASLLYDKQGIKVFELED